ncbi:hypothetical protein [Rheinheimera sp. 1928-s]|uniref:hypothetical protein n=1 Tax=Rheinheimera sp. 1928-s TaxID=3033803 RepID=UPI00263571BC|nr:hypothetical protein [Rheinheimera sp. 1928-s]MDF3127412.1 hypothetical protein [Rheinheimera sp. 1928-s]
MDFVVYAVGMVFLVVLASTILENNERKMENAIENHSDSWVHFLKEHATTLISAVLCFVIATVSPKWQTNILYIFACHQFVFFLLVAGKIRLRNEFGSTGLIWTHTLLTFATLLTAFSVYSALSIKNETGRSHITLATCQQCYLMRVYDDFFMFWDASDRTVKVVSKNEIKTLTIPVK